MRTNPCFFWGLRNLSDDVSAFHNAEVKGDISDMALAALLLYKVNS
jgi:hypothetical protein